MSKIIVEGTAKSEYQDGDQALIIEVNSCVSECVFVRIQSWDESKQHRELEVLKDKRLRVTIEVLD